MLGKNRIKKYIALLTVVAIWCVTSMVALAAPNNVSGDITVTGQVTVNGQTAVSNSTVISGSVITTGANSSAVISLGKLGKIEILEDSNFTLRFTDNSITGILTQGKARISNAAGIATSVATNDATTIADAGQANNFLVEVECSHTHVDTVSGLVTMRTGNNDKQVAAGTSATAGNLSQTGCKPCVRPGSGVKTPVLGLGAGALAAILIGAGVGIGTAVLLGGNDSDISIGGGTVVVSPVR
ncbi:MAG TPA: hypothetical protein PKE69_19375 [Pyrinomonadaceae bacterium]|nr:hypothetical protein [Pyrinomonadaceae bacterium]